MLYIGVSKDTGPDSPLLYISEDSGGALGQRYCNGIENQAHVVHLLMFSYLLFYFNPFGGTLHEFSILCNCICNDN